MGAFFPLLGWLFSWGSLGIIGLAVFSFVSTMAGFIGGGIVFFFIGKGNYDIWRAWWIIISGGLILSGLIKFIAMF